MPNGSDRITGLDAPAVTTDKQVEDPELRAVLTASLKSKKKKKAAAAKAAPAGA